MKISSPSILDSIWFKLRKGDYVSGEDLARELNVSKVAIWKAIRKLEKLGYKVEKARRLGYRLLYQPNLPHPWRIREMLRTKLIGRRFIYYKELDSTQRVAKELAEVEKEGLVIIAEKQRRGRGRLGRIWLSSVDDLKMSIVLKPSNLHPVKLGLFSLIGGLAVAKALKNLDVKLKWPNDVLLNERKVAGILVEGKVEADRISYIVLGIGINVNSKKENLKGINAISIYDVLNEKQDLAELTAKVLNELDLLYMKIGDEARILKEVKERLGTIGKLVKVIGLDEEFEGKAIDIDGNGFLLVNVNGNVRRVLAGDVIHLREIA